MFLSEFRPYTTNTVGKMSVVTVTVADCFIISNRCPSSVAVWDP